MAGQENNYTKADESRLQALDQYLFSKNEGSDTDKRSKKIKAGTALINDPKFSQYSKANNRSLDSIRRQMSMLQQEIQQIKDQQALEGTNDAEPEPMMAAPAAVAQQRPENEDDGKDDVREGEEGRMNEDDARAEAEQVRAGAQDKDGNTTRDSYQAASDKIDADKQKEKEIARPGEPTNRMSLDDAREDVARNGGGNSKNWQKDPSQKLRKPDDKYKTAGGKAIQPQSSKLRDGLGAAKDPKKQFQKKMDKEAAAIAGKGVRAGLTAAGLGVIAGAADAVTKWATEKALPWLREHKEFLLSYPSAVVILLVVGSVGIAYTMMQRDGRNGGTNVQAMDPTNQGDIADIRALLGQNYHLNGNIGDWYLRQNDPAWSGNNRGNMANDLGRTGCVISSMAMIAKYNGLNVTPVTVAPGCEPNTHQCFMNWITTSIKTAKNEQRKWLQVPKSLDAIRAQLATGEPVFAYGQGTFGSQGPHAVVIVGVTDQGTLILNDPYHGSGFKSAFEPSKISKILVFVKK